ncbi:unnamed protein product [Symbiodinium sp. CCMP2592]|nr:unnamed protein product [Symbiodinium sp. CCMP2592]
MAQVPDSLREAEQRANQATLHALQPDAPQPPTHALRHGFARGFAPPYHAAADPWHEDGYLTAEEMGAPTDPWPHQSGETQAMTSSQQQQPQPLQPAAPQQEAPPYPFDSDRPPPPFDGWTTLAFRYAGVGPLLPPHLWRDNPLGLDRVRQPYIAGFDGETTDGEASTTASSRDALGDDFVLPPPPDPEQDLPPPAGYDPGWLPSPTEPDLQLPTSPESPQAAQPAQVEQSQRNVVMDNEEDEAEDDTCTSSSSSSLESDSPDDAQEEVPSSSSQPMARGAPRKRKAGHGSQRVKNKGEKSDVKQLWGQLDWGEKPPWLSWRKALSYIKKGVKPPWRQPTIRLEDDAMIKAMLAAQDYTRDKDGNVVKGSTTGGPKKPAQGSKAQSSAEADHEQRLAANPYLQPQAAGASSSSTAAASQNTAMAPVRGHAGPTRGQDRAVTFSLPADHREHPPAPTRKRPMLRSLNGSTQTRLRIDGLRSNPVIIVDNRPPSLHPTTAEIIAERASASTHSAVTSRGTRPGSPLFYQPPPLRDEEQAGQDDGATAGSSRDPPQPQLAREDPEPADIKDLENRSRQASMAGRAPTWVVEQATDQDTLQSTLRTGANTQDLSWVWGAPPSSLPPAVPLDARQILTMRGAADGSWRGVVWTPADRQQVRHPSRLRQEPTVVIFNTLSGHKEKGGTLPPGTRLTMTPVGPWIATTRFELGFARTPRYWLVEVDEVAQAQGDQGWIPLANINSGHGDHVFLEMWTSWGAFPLSRNLIRRDRPRHQKDDTLLDGVPTTGYLNTNAVGDLLQYLNVSLNVNANVTIHLNSPQHEHKGSESETSWPSEDAEEDHGSFMQAQASRNPRGVAPGENPGNDSHDDRPRAPPPPGTVQGQADDLQTHLHQLLEQSFRQPNEEVTTLAYRACHSLHRLQDLLQAQADTPLPPPPMPTVIQNTLPMAMENPLAEAQVLLRQLLQNYDTMQVHVRDGHLDRVDEAIATARSYVRDLTRQRYDTAEALAGLRTMAANLAHLDLTLEEGGLASIQEAMEVLASTADRTATYVDTLLAASVSSLPTDSKSTKRRASPPRSMGWLDYLNVTSLSMHKGILLDNLDHDPAEHLELAALLTEAHGFLFAWTSALWGHPILLVSDNQIQQEPPVSTTTMETGNAPPDNREELEADSDAPTLAFMPSSPACAGLGDSVPLHWTGDYVYVTIEYYMLNGDLANHHLDDNMATNSEASRPNGLLRSERGNKLKQPRTRGNNLCIGRRVENLETNFEQHVERTTQLLGAMTDRHCDIEHTVKKVDQSYEDVRRRLELLEGKFATATFSTTTNTSLRTTETGGQDATRPAIIMGGWDADQSASETLRLVKQHIAHIDIDMDDAFVPGIRRGFAIVPVAARAGESQGEFRARIREALKEIRESKVITGQRPEGGDRHFWAAMSESPERRKRARFAGKIKRLILEMQGDKNKLDVEFGTGNVWYSSIKIASATTPPPAGAETTGIGSSTVSPPGTTKDDRKIVIGVDANETFKAGHEDDVLSDSARGELILTWWTALNGDIPPQKLEKPSCFPYNRRMHPRRLDYIFTRTMTTAEGNVGDVRHLATSDHEPAWVSCGIQSERTKPPKRDKPWGCRQLRDIKFVEKVLATTPRTSGDPLKQLRDISVAVTKPGRGIRGFQESEELKVRRQTIIRMIPGDEQRRQWKEVLKLRRQEHRTWKQTMHEKAGKGFWHSKKVVDSDGHTTAWELQLQDDERWRETLHKHFSDIFSKRARLEVDQRLQEITKKLTAMCKHAIWRPFDETELKAVRKRWKPITLSSTLLKTFSQLIIHRTAHDWGIPMYIAKLDIRKAFDSIYQEALAEQIAKDVGEDGGAPWEARAWVQLLTPEKSPSTFAGKTSWWTRPTEYDKAAQTAPSPSEGSSLSNWRAPSNKQPPPSALSGNRHRKTGLDIHPDKTEIIDNQNGGVPFQVAGNTVESKGPKHVIRTLGSPVCFASSPTILVAEMQGAFGKHRGTLMSKAPLKSRLQLHTVLVRQSALWACETWPCVDYVLKAANTLQLLHARAMMSPPRQAGESWPDWNVRTMRRARLQLHQSKIDRWSSFILQQIWGLMGHIAHGDVVASKMLRWRDLRWWRVEQSVPQSWGGERHASRFHPLLDVERQISDIAGEAWQDVAQDRLV